MEHLLIHPPLADPTQPYLSLPTLKGHLRARGLDARVLDLNLEAILWLLEPATLRSIAERIGRRFLELDHRDRLLFDEQREYRALVQARPVIEDLLGAEPTPAAVFRDEERFFDPDAYAVARRRADGALEALSAAHFPYRFGFNRLDREVVPWSFDLVAEYAADDVSPFAGFYRRVFEAPDDWNALAEGAPWVDLESVGFIGISIVFPSQLAEAFHLARYLRRRAPRAFVAFGGPLVHQSVAHLEDSLKARFFEYVDGVGLYEGEPLLEQLLPLLPAWRQAEDERSRHAALAGIPNLLLREPEAGAIALGPRATVDLRDAAAPDYSDLDLDRYLAPTRTLLYAPTRGCYWGKCSFCYYGLADTATAAYREIPPERVAADLARLSQRHGVRNFYLSCDVLAPRYAVRLAEALAERAAGVRWHCDLKIEPYFTADRVALLHRGGLRAAAFGIESGSDRILALMRKGCDRRTMTDVNRLFADAAIATQWMTFTDHPGESLEEALSTAEWIEAESERIALFLVGEFGLQQGSHVAAEPGRYGVEQIWFAAGDEFRLYALFRQRGGPRSEDAESRIESAIARAAQAFSPRPYPWAGAISTHHSFLHFLRFGSKVFKTHFQRAAAPQAPAPLGQVASHVAGLRRRPRFSLERIEKNEARFFARFLPRALYTTLPERRGLGPGKVAPLSIESYRDAATEVEPLRPFRRGE